MANNEIGVLQPLSELTKLCSERGIVFHTDAAQAFGQLTFNLDHIGIDLLTISGHKIYGPKGIGALVIKPNVPILPLQWGGGQELGLRAGTVPVPLAVGLAKAAEIIFRDLNSRQLRLGKLRNQLWETLKRNLPDLIINGSISHRLEHNLNFTVPGVKGNHLHKALRPFLNCSSGSACSNGEASYVLREIGRTKEEAESSLRLSLGRSTTIDQVDMAVNVITQVVKRMREE